MRSNNSIGTQVDKFLITSSPFRKRHNNILHTSMRQYHQYIACFLSVQDDLVDQRMIDPSCTIVSRISIQSKCTKLLMHKAQESDLHPILLNHMQAISIVQCTYTHDVRIRTKCFDSLLTSFLVLIHHMVVGHHDNVSTKAFNESRRVFRLGQRRTTLVYRLSRTSYRSLKVDSYKVCTFQ